MNIPIVILIAFFLLWSLNSTARGYINGAITGTAAFIVGILPTVGGIIGIIIILLISLILTGGSWVALWAKIGSFTHSPMAGLVFGICSILGIIFFRGFFRVVAFLALLVIGFGFITPPIKNALNNYSENGQVEVANKLDALAAKMHPKGIALAVALEDSVLYDDEGKQLTIAVTKEQELKTVSLERRQFLGGPETFVQVMLPNVNGDFLEGSSGWIPIRKIKIGTTLVSEPPEKQKQEDCSVYYPPVVVEEESRYILPDPPTQGTLLQEEAWILQYVGDSESFPVSVTKTEKGGLIIEGGNMFFDGVLTADGYRGSVRENSQFGVALITIQCDKTAVGLKTINGKTEQFIMRRSG